jgi:hypothetical protein
MSGPVLLPTTFDVELYDEVVQCRLKLVPQQRPVA